jgi:hypothetical protein
MWLKKSKSIILPIFSEKAQLQDIICHQEALIEEQNELGGIIVNNLMTSNTVIQKYKNNGMLIVSAK